MTERYISGMLAKSLLLIDVETTGIDPAQDCIVQISAGLLSRKDLTIEREFTSLVRPTSPMGERARAIHGLADEALLTAAPLTTVLLDFDRFAPRDVILAGHNIAFDAAFLRAAYTNVGLAFDFDYHLLDVWSISFFVLGAQGVPLNSYSLNGLCALFGLQREYHHDAAQDVRVTAAILRHLFDAARAADLSILGQFGLFDAPR